MICEYCGKEIRLLYIKGEPFMVSKYKSFGQIVEDLHTCVKVKDK